MDNVLEVIELINNAKELIKGENKWCRKYMAKNSKDESCSPYIEEACKFCAYGSLHAVNGNNLNKYRNTIIPALIELDKIAKQRYNRSIVRLNDELGHKEVIDVFDATIKHLKALKAAGEIGAENE